MKKSKIYNWHSGAPSDQQYKIMSEKILDDIHKMLNKRKVNIDILKSNKYKKIKYQNSIDIH
jgi:hypothetical protein